jgi:uncharacterized protein YegP (UPF0339 family)
MAAKFVLKKGSTGKFRFNLVATNGQVIATSETYESKASAISGIESVKRSASDAEIDDQTDKLAGSFRSRWDRSCPAGEGPPPAHARDLDWCHLQPTAGVGGGAGTGPVAVCLPRGRGGGRWRPGAPVLRVLGRGQRDERARRARPASAIGRSRSAVATAACWWW